MAWRRFLFLSVPRTDPLHNSIQAHLAYPQPNVTTSNAHFQEPVSLTKSPHNCQALQLRADPLSKPRGSDTYDVVIPSASIPGVPVSTSSRDLQ